MLGQWFLQENGETDEHWHKFKCIRAGGLFPPHPLLTIPLCRDMGLHGGCGLGAIVWVEGEKENEGDYYYWG